MLGPLYHTIRPSCDQVYFESSRPCCIPAMRRGCAAVGSVPRTSEAPERVLAVCVCVFLKLYVMQVTLIDSTGA